MNPRLRKKLDAKLAGLMERQREREAVRLANRLKWQKRESAREYLMKVREASL
jgi:hypothetical protein